jgi:DNA topoisomerase IB
VRFRFTGKSGKQWSLRVRDRRIAKIIRDRPGQELLQYVDEAGNCQDVTSTDGTTISRKSPARISPRRLSHLAGHGPRGYGPQ